MQPVLRAECRTRGRLLLLFCLFYPELSLEMELELSAPFSCCQWRFMQKEPWQKHSLDPTALSNGLSCLWPGFGTFRGHLQCCWTAPGQTCRTELPVWHGNKEDTGEFWPFRSDQTLKLLLADPTPRWGTRAQLCLDGRTPRWEQSFVFLLVEM